jgi:NTP pyrophosphatase (non-canonical NTP hydrolase)
MDLQTYQTQAWRTANVKHNITTSKAVLLNMAMGLTGEAAELFVLLTHFEPHMTDDILNEAGDILWYTTGLATAINMTLEDAISAETFEDLKPAQITFPTAAAYLIKATGAISEHLKKHIFQGHEFRPTQIIAHTTLIAEILATIGYILDKPLVDIAAHNIAKLTARYPTGTFRAEDSRNRPVKTN